MQYSIYNNIPIIIAYQLFSTFSILFQSSFGSGAGIITLTLSGTSAGDIIGLQDESATY